MTDDDLHGDLEERRPLGMVLLGGLYLFFFLLTMSTFGHPFPFMGEIYQGRTAELIVFLDSLLCLYLFLGLMKRQVLTWYLIIGYNIFELLNSIVNLMRISPADLEKTVGEPVNQQGLIYSNISVMIAILLLTFFVFSQKHNFTNKSRYLF